MGVGLRPPVYVAFDAASLTGAVFGRGFGRRRLRSFVRIPLPPDALAPSAVSPNVLRPEETRDALRRLRQQLGRGGPATLVLPEGVARLALLEVEGENLRDYARFRLGPSLPYPAGEAVVDVLPAGPGRALAAAVRRSIVEEYEAAATAAGFTRERVDLAPFIGLAGMLQRDRAPKVHALLGEAALCLAAFDGRGIAVVRQRRRDPAPGEGERLFAEAARTARLLGDGDAFRLTLCGAGAGELARELVAAGLPAESRGPAEPAGAGEVAWLTGLLA
jgi:hypothetical protein